MRLPRAPNSLSQHPVHRSQAPTQHLAPPPRRARINAKMSKTEGANACERVGLPREREIKPPKVRSHIKPHASSHLKPTDPHPLPHPCAPPFCAGLPDLSTPLLEAATRIVNVTDGDVGPLGADKLVEGLTEAVLVHALEALEAAVRASGRSISGRRQQAYFTWLIRDALGVPTAVASKAAQGAGDRMLKAALKVRAAGGGTPKPYPEPGAPPLPWDALPEEPPAAPAAPPPPPPQPQQHVPEFKLADYVSDFSHLEDGRLLRKHMGWFRDYFENNEDFREGITCPCESWRYWGPLMMAASLRDVAMLEKRLAEKEKELEERTRERDEYIERNMKLVDDFAKLVDN